MRCLKGEQGEDDALECGREEEEASWNGTHAE